MKFTKLLTILIVVIFVSGCNVKQNKEDLKKDNMIILSHQQEINANIQVEKLAKKNIDLQITIPAQFKAQNQFVDRIYSPLDGKVSKVFVEPGAKVKVGQPLIQIKSDEISQIQLEFLEKIMEIDAAINEMKAQYELSEQNYNREYTLFKEKISSKAEYEMANAQVKKDKSNLNALNMKRAALIKVYDNRLNVYGATSIYNVMKTKRIYPYITLNANKNGVLLERKVNPGEIVEKNEELFNLADLSKIWLVGYAFEKDSPYLKVGQNIVGTIENKKRTIQGVLSYVSPILDRNSKTLEVRADVNNDKNLDIKPNTYAEMKVKIATVDVLAVPNDAIEKYGDYYFVYVMIKPQVYEERKVEIGKKNDQYTEIISGISEGESVVTVGSFELLGERIKQTEGD